MRTHPTHPTHPFATRWNQDTHYYPLLAARVPITATSLLDVGCGDGTFCRFFSTERLSVAVALVLSRGRGIPGEPGIPALLRGCNA